MTTLFEMTYKALKTEESQCLQAIESLKAQLRANKQNMEVFKTSLETQDADMCIDATRMVVDRCLKLLPENHPHRAALVKFDELLEKGE